MPTRRTCAALRNHSGRERARSGVHWVMGVGEHKRSGHAAALDGGCAVCRASLIVLGQEVDEIAAERSFQLVSAKFAGELILLLVQLQRKIDRSTVEISAADPSSGDNRIHRTRRFLRVL